MRTLGFSFFPFLTLLDLTNPDDLSFLAFAATVVLLAALVVTLVATLIVYSKKDGKYYRNMSSGINSVRIYRIEAHKGTVVFFDLGKLSPQRRSSLNEFYTSFPGSEPQRVRNWIEDILAEKKATDYLQTSVYFHRSKCRMNAFLHIRKSDPVHGIIHLESYLLPERKVKANIGSLVRLSSEKEFSEGLRSISGYGGTTYCFSLVQTPSVGARKKEKVSLDLSYRFRMALEPFVRGSMKLIQASENEFLIASFDQSDQTEAISFALLAVNEVQKRLAQYSSNKNPIEVRVGIVLNKDLMGDGDAIISSARRTAKNAFETKSSIAFFKKGTEDYSLSEITQYRSEVERIIYEKKILYTFRPVYAVSRKRVIGYLGKASPRSECAFDSIDELKNYAIRAKDDKNLFAAIAKNLVGTFVSERELKSQKLYYPARPDELSSIPSFFKRLRGAKDANLVFLLANDDISSFLANNGIDTLLENIKNVKEAGYGIAYTVRGKSLGIDAILLAEADAFFVDFLSSDTNTGLDTGIRSQLHALVEKLLKYKKPIIGSNLSSWNALELVVGSGIEYISSDVFAPYSTSLTPVNEKNENRILILKGKM